MSIALIPDITSIDLGSIREGVWNIETQSASYLLDFNRSLWRRVPNDNATPGHKVASFEEDGSEEHLERAVGCFGMPMQIFGDPFEFHGTPRRTTTRVSRIERLN